MRLIDADALKIELAILHGGDYKTIHYLNHARTVDAVPVIRCRDCKWYEEDIGCDWGVCFHDDWTHRDVGHGVDGDGYCYRAERKEE